MNSCVKMSLLYLHYALSYAKRIIFGKPSVQILSLLKNLKFWIPIHRIIYTYKCAYALVSNEKEEKHEEQWKNLNNFWRLSWCSRHTLDQDFCLIDGHFTLEGKSNKTIHHRNSLQISSRARNSFNVFVLKHSKIIHNGCYFSSTNSN